jgi:hypothetical protein
MVSVRLTVFTHLEITRQVDSVGDDIVRPCRKVHVTDRLARQHKTSYHLGKVVGRNTVSITRVKECALEQRSVPFAVLWTF